MPLRRQSFSASENQFLDPRASNRFEELMRNYGETGGNAISAPSDYEPPRHIPSSESISSRTRSRYESLMSKSSVMDDTCWQFLPDKLKAVGCPTQVFLSELLPRSWDFGKRWQFLDIMFAKAPYIPLCVRDSDDACHRVQIHVLDEMLHPYGGRSPNKSSQSNTLTARKTADLPLGAGRRGWPQCDTHFTTLPTEIYQLIASYLPRDAQKNMRLVSREFERSVSKSVFQTVVVPFRPEIYGIMTHSGGLEAKAADKKKRMKGKGKGKARATGKSGHVDVTRRMTNGSLAESEEDERQKIIDDGMNTFRAWGPHIKQFAMVFDVDEGK